MKRTQYRIQTLVAILIIMTIIAGCGRSGGDSKLAEDKTNVVTSFYPLYFLAQQIGGDKVQAINLIPAGIEPHEWTPKSRDLFMTSQAQLFLYNGAGMEGWVDNFLKGLSKDSKLLTKSASDGIVLIDSEGKEDGHNHSEDGDGNDGHNEEHHHAGDHDPHTWVSPKSMIIMADNVLQGLITVDSKNKSVYESNYKALKQQLEELDADYTAKLSTVSKKEIVTSHQSFGYLARDYGLEQVAIMGLSPDAEPRAQDLLRITNFVKEHGITHIFFEELVSDKLAKTLASEAGISTLVLNPMEGLTPSQEESGEDYFSIMRTNLQNLQQALQ